MIIKSFKTKILIPAVIVLVALVVVLNIFLYIRFAALNEILISEKVIANSNSLKFYLNDSKANSRTAAVSTALNPNIINAIKERDTSRLLGLFLPMLSLYQVSYYTICDSEGTVLARTHQPDIFGDSVLNQQNIRDALEGKTSSYFESGTTVKVSVRTGSPVYDTDGSLIGVISAGIQFDLESQVDQLKSLFNSEVTIFLGDTRIATTIIQDGQRIIGTTLDPHIAEIVIKNKHEYTGEAEILGEKYYTFYMPLLNAQNEAFAVFFLGIPEADMISTANKSIRDGIILGLAGLAISITLMFIIISSISKPISKLSDDMNHIANGNLLVKISTKGEDEIGKLGKSLQKVADIIRKLLQDINTMISEQSKGNTDHSLDTSEFFGDYKILAENILELASISMYDQLTKIPNRRSFDNRLEWEWVRAIREKNPVSILMMDVDKFKNYNDSFGHQQGDAALQTVAKTIRESVKRSMDFIARWGGEEFIILLPTTDSKGALLVAETARKAIESAEIPCNDNRALHVTVSIGVNTQVPGLNTPISNLISGVDNALYEAKETGRNRVVLFGDGVFLS